MGAVLVRNMETVLDISKGGEQLMNRKLCDNRRDCNIPTNLITSLMSAGAKTLYSEISSLANPGFDCYKRWKLAI
jgi:hypothetical protein